MTTTMLKQYSPSVNIIRDQDKDLNYVVTPNTQSAFVKITNEYVFGVRSFTIIGAYGTGKSSFLWAFNKALNKEVNYFEEGHFNKFKGAESINIVGDYSSFIDAVANSCGLEGDYTNADILATIEKRYNEVAKEDKMLILFIDEFGKFLEYAAKENPDQELYFIQQLAEFANDLSREICLITTLHQGFSSYAFGLSRSQQNEWTKVKGRLREIPFNEPVEQLLYLASERLTELDNKPALNKELFELIKSSKSFPLKDYFTEDIAQKLLPFDMLSAAVLTLGLQSYGQNERSLFSFIDSDDHLAIRAFESNSDNPLYSLSSVYDYLVHNYTILFTKYNPHYAQWAAIRTAIERAEGVFEDDIEDALKILKTIGLLSIFAAKSAILDDAFYKIYGTLSLGVSSPEKILKELEQHKIIRYVQHKKSYILFEGTDLDIENAIADAANKIEETQDIVKSLKEYFDFSYVLAKAVYFEKGTPRFFEFVLSEAPLKQTPTDQIDGYINLIFSEELSEDYMIKASKKKSPTLYGWVSNTKDIRAILFEIKKIQKVIDSNQDDKVAVRELKSIKNHQIELLNDYVANSLYKKDSFIKWYYNGNKESFSSQRAFNKKLSAISNEIYSKVPTYRNEMVNKTKLSTPIRTALKKLVRSLTNNWQEDNLGFPDKKFPPEKTIYLSLIKETGIIQKVDGVNTFCKPSDKSFNHLWKVSEKFLDSSKSAQRTIRDFKELLLKAPFKLKAGFIDFWVPIFLFAKRDEYALFEGDVYIPKVTDQVLEVLNKNPHKYSIKAFNIEGVRLELFQRYRKLLGQGQSDSVGNQSFIETIRPFLSFYRQLPDYAKNTKRLSSEALMLRDAIAKAKDPEKAFFDSFPTALGVTPKMLEDDGQLEEYIETLQTKITEIRKAYDELLGRFEAHIKDFLACPNKNFKAWRKVLQSRFKDARIHLLQPKQKVFIQRVNSDLDRISWLNSLSQACIGKTLERITDREEPILHDKFVEYVEQMDNLTELSSIQAEEIEDSFVSIALTSLDSGTNKKIVRLPKEKQSKIKEQKEKIRELLGNEKDVNIAAMTQLFKELLSDD